MQSSFGCSASTPALQFQFKLSPPIAVCCCSAATSRSRSTDGLAASKTWSLQSPLRLFPVLSPFHTVSMERVEWILMLPTVLLSAHWACKHKAKVYKYQEWKKWWLERGLDLCFMKYGIAMLGYFLGLAYLHPDWWKPGFMRSCCAWPLKGQKKVSKKRGECCWDMWDINLSFLQHHSILLFMHFFVERNWEGTCTT